MNYDVMFCFGVMNVFSGIQKKKREKKKRLTK